VISFAPHRALRSLAVALGFDHIEVVFAADARGKIHRQFLTEVPDLRVIA